MKIFKSIDEIKQYYNASINTYDFTDDVSLKFDLCVDADIRAGNIKAWNIKAKNIKAEDINAMNIRAENIEALDIKAIDIKAENIKAWDINANDIKAGDINALDIDAKNINANDIKYYAICCAHESMKCKSIKGTRQNAKHIVLDGEIQFLEG